MTTSVSDRTGSGSRSGGGTGGVHGTLREAWALVAGVTRRPVETYEKIALTPSPRGGALFVGLLALAAGIELMAITAWSHGGAVRALGGLLGGLLAVFGVFLAASALIWLVGRALGSRGTFEAYLTAWAGSYVPTTAWFVGMLLFHILFAPSGLIDPGVFGSAGQLVVQSLFLAFSVGVFLWKLLLLYLTLRVVGSLDFRRIVAAAAILAPVAMAYWLAGFYFGWFKVPLI